MYTGTVVWFKSERGFGFIRRDNDGTEFFAHFNYILMDGYKKLDAGDMVEFTVAPGPKGKMQAENIRVLQKAVA